MKNNKIREYLGFESRKNKLCQVDLNTLEI